MAVLILAGCREGRDKELPQMPASVDTSEFDEAYYERMRRWDALHGGMRHRESDK